MEAAIQELLRDFFHEANVPAGSNDIDLPLQRLVDATGAGSAVVKRDLRRLLEKDSTGFLQSACRILKADTQKTGLAPLLDLVWSSGLLLTSLVDPAMLPLPTAIALAGRWVAFDPMLDIKLLQIGFPLGDDDAVWKIDVGRSQRSLDIVSGLPPNRHVLLALARLLRHPDPFVRSKAALLYARASKNPEWVRKMLAEPDPRLRANAVEGLWDARSPFAAGLFREAALDPDPRVAANALIGLHYCGESEDDINDVLQNMACNNDPHARAAAAFAIGHIMETAGASMLETLLRDGDAAVRGQALRALIRIRRQDRPEAAPDPPAPQAALPPEIPPADSAPADSAPAEAGNPPAPAPETVESVTS